MPVCCRKSLFWKTGFCIYFALFFPLAQQFPLNCCRATLRRSNYACLLRKIDLFRLFAAVVKPPHCTTRSVHLCSTTLSACNNQLCLLHCLVSYFALSTLHFALSFPPTVAREWRRYATKHVLPPQIRQMLPVLSPLSAILPAPPLPPQQKSLPVFRLGLYSVLSFAFTHHCFVFRSELGTLNSELFDL
jgi:hypothetical protein